MTTLKGYVRACWSICLNTLENENNFRSRTWITAETNPKMECLSAEHPRRLGQSIGDKPSIRRSDGFRNRSYS